MTWLKEVQETANFCKNAIIAPIEWAEQLLKDKE